MRTSLRFSIGLSVLLLSVSIYADDHADALTIVDKAIQASGGEQNLAKHKSVTFKETGTYHGMGAALPYTGEYAVRHPGQFRMEIADTFVIVLNGDQGWVKTGNMTTEMTKEQLAAQQEEQFAGWLGTLLPLKEKGVRLAPLGESQIDGAAALGVKASSDGHRDVKLYFSKDSGLLVKMDYRVNAQELNGQEVDQEVLFSDYQDVQGAKCAMKVVINRQGKPFVEARVTEMELDAKLDESTFAKP